MHPSDNGQRYRNAADFRDQMAARLSRVRILILVAALLAGIYGPQGAWW